jgi:NAD(P)-dependent dehydrogenase (short-subunit alcohol dehydrogenase family)
VTGRAGAVVTGAGRGLGRQIAELLVARGHTVLVTDIDSRAAADTARQLGPRAFARALDVREHDQVEAARDEIVEQAGRLEVWVNNAGVLMTGPAWEQTPDLWRLMLDVNSLGVINGTVAAIHTMRTSGGGHVDNIASLAGLTPVPGEAVYAASKHAVLGFSLSTMADLKAAGITGIEISCICPDGIWTPMLHDKLSDPGAAMSFSGTLLQPEDVVATVRRVLDKPKLVTALPRWRGVAARFGSSAPQLGLAAVPLLARQGRRTQRKLRDEGGPAAR